MKLISAQVKTNLETFQPELEVTVSLSIELMQDETVIDANFAEKVGKEFLTLLKDYAGSK